MKRRKIAILGSTGSIGTQALDVIAQFPEFFEITGLAAGRRVPELIAQCRRFGVRRLSVAEAAGALAATQELGSGYEVDYGSAGLEWIAADTGADIVLAATDGAAAFGAAFAAVRRGIDLAVANKELIVAAGELLMQLARAHGVRILPVDSEHSAIFQCLAGEDPGSVERIILTASGGPFRRATPEQIAAASPADALAHPTWTMGVKNSIDSATMMNKGLEVIEAGRLFDLPAERIDVVIHPSSFVHGFVHFTDGNIKAQMAAPDMRLPIGYALAYPLRLPAAPAPAPPAPLQLLGAPLEATALGLEFEAVDPVRFPALGLAYQALRAGGTLPCALSAANEVAVAAFYKEKIGFTMIIRIVAEVLEAMPQVALSLESLAEADRHARREAQAVIERLPAQL